MPDAWKEAASEVLQENTAQAIHQQLEQLENQKDRYSRRWIWELFQNALDAVPEGQPAKIQIRHQGNKFAFSHNGAPFHQKEILHLIYHGSTKREREGVIGRYGTGFLTTHVLSRRVRICGSLNTDERFDFLLDRTGATPSEIAKAMAGSFENLRESINVDRASNSTTFEYDLDGPAADLVNVALNDLRFIAPFVLAFNPAIASIEIAVDDVLSLTILDRHTGTPFESAHLVECGDMSTRQVEWRCCLVEDADLAIAIPLGGSSTSRTITIPETLPRLFVAFPLFGTEQLPLPFVLNCIGKPTEKRDGLFLGHEETDDNKQNKEHVERGWVLFKSILQNAASANWEDLSQLARVGPAPAHEWLDGDWFDNLTKSNLSEHIATSPLVRTASGDTVSPRKAVFPLPPDGTDSDKFFELVQPIYGGGVVPAREVMGPWVEVLAGWSKLTSEVDLVVSTVRLADLGRRVSGLKSLGAIEQALQSESAAIGAVGWLSAFLDAVFASGDQSILDKEELLPDQNGTLQVRSQLKRDSNIEEQLKVISIDLGSDIRAELLDGRLGRSVQELLSPLTSDVVSMSLLTRVISRAKTDYNSDNYRRANATLFAWFAAQRRPDALRSFPFIGCEIDQSGKERLVVGREQLLAPADIWPATATPFFDLFPAGYVASRIYSQAVDRVTWDWLEGQRFFLLDPVIRHSLDVDGDDLAGLLELPFQRDQEDLDHKIQGLQVVDLAHLNLKDKGIIDTVRNSKPKATRFLEFIVRHVLVSDSADSLAYQTKECVCTTKHSIHNALWISTLRNRQWVYERKGHAGRPSAANVAKIWKDSPELMGAIARTEVILFLRRLEINASEVQRGASSMPESDSLNMEKAMVALLAATKNDVSRLQKLAEISSADPDFIDEYDKRLKQRERVRLNQKIGTSIEALFKSIFEGPEFVNLGLRITRTGWGSDFCIEHDLVDESGEVAFELRSTHGSSFLVELKSTFGSAVSMSEKQGNEAVTRRDSFALVVVPLQSEAIAPETLRETVKFVPDIGRLLKDAVVDLKSLRDLEVQAAISGSDVDVVIQGSEVLYKVKEPVWTGGLDFQQFITFLLRFFGVDR